MLKILSCAKNQYYKDFCFKNCYFDVQIHFNSSRVNNILFTNCIFNRNNALAFSNLNCSNTNGGNIRSNGNLNGEVFIRNSVFLNSMAYDVFAATGLVIENNIFYTGQPSGASLSIFNNNITFANNGYNTLPYGDNFGSGNLANVNPMFVNFPYTGGGFDWSYDFALQPGSPAIGAGTNGTDIGITGGNAPLLHNLIGNSKLPVVTQITLPVSSVPVGGTLQINVKAKTRK